jgi:hypothetical protein
MTCQYIPEHVKMVRSEHVWILLEVIKQIRKVCTVRFLNPVPHLSLTTTPRKVSYHPPEKGKHGYCGYCGYQNNHDDDENEGSAFRRLGLRLMALNINLASNLKGMERLCGNVGDISGAETIPELRASGQRETMGWTMNKTVMGHQKLVTLSAWFFFQFDPVIFVVWSLVAVWGLGGKRRTREGRAGERWPGERGPPVGMIPDLGFSQFVGISILENEDLLGRSLEKMFMMRGFRELT